MSNLIDSVVDAVMGTEVSNILDQFPDYTLPENPDRTLVKQGAVSLKTEKVRSTAIIYLFNDFILVAEGEDCKSFEMSKVTVSTGRSHLNVNSWGKKVFSFKAVTSEEQSEWKKVLNAQTTVVGKINKSLGPTINKVKSAVTTATDAVEDAVDAAEDLVGSDIEVSAASLRKVAQADKLSDVEELVNKGVNVNGRDEEGNTALHLASSLEIATLLVASGARRLENHDGVVAGANFEDLKMREPAATVGEKCCAEADWTADDASQECQLCSQQFGLMTRRHHCRACGILCCKSCSLNTYVNAEENKRVCDGCFNVMVVEANKETGLLEEATGAVADTVGDATGAVADVVGDATEAVADVAGDAKEVVTDAAEDVAEAATKTKKSVMSKLKNNVFSRSVKKIYKKTKAVAVDAADAVGDVIEDAVDAVEDAVDAVEDTVGDLANGLGEASLRKAVQADQVSVVEYLIKKGVNVNDRDGDGSTPLHVAKSQAVAEALVQAGARFLENSDGFVAGSNFEGLEEREAAQTSGDKVCDQADWVANDVSAECQLCSRAFGLVTRRHHCRACGVLCCGACSKNTYGEENTRCCDGCFNEMKADASGKEEKEVESSGMMSKMLDAASELVDAEPSQRRVSAVAA